MMIERKLAWLCVLATLALQLLWPQTLDTSIKAAWIAPTVALLPSLPLLLAWLFRLAHPLYYAGLSMLIYFSLTATEAYVQPATRIYAAVQIALCLGYFGLLLLIRRRGKAAAAAGRQA